VRWIVEDVYRRLGPKNRKLLLSNIRGAISGAFDISQSLPEGLKLYFAEQTLMLGGRLSALNAMDEAVHILQISISSIDLLGSAVSGVVWRYQISISILTESLHDLIEVIMIS
jgi:hypothetical protein